MKTILILFFTMTLSFANHQSRPSFYDWCNDVTRNLSQAKTDSMLAYQYGDFQSALTRLKSEFSSLYNGDMQAYNHSITLQLLRRGLALTEILERHLTNDPRNLRLTNLFLHKYTDFVIKTANSLDLPYYTYDCRYCQRDIEELEETITAVAFDQVSMVLENFAIPSGQLVYPKGSADLLLKLLEVTSHSSATDLQNSFFAELYSCQIRDLYSIHGELNQYNSNTPKPPYMNDRNMVQKAYRQALDIVNGHSGSCHGSRPGYGTRPGKHFSKVIAKNLIVRKRNGDYVLHLDHPMRISRLVIWSEGIRYDAKYDVIVNGIEKGTIYVPGRDPKYYVTVNATTTKIIFRPDFGNARINKIVVER